MADARKPAIFAFGDPRSRTIALEATWAIDNACADYLAQALDDGVAISVEEAALNRRARSYALRVQQLNSLLMSYLSDDSVTVDAAYRTVFGVEPPEAP